MSPAQGCGRAWGTSLPSSSSAWPHSFWASCSRGLAAELLLELQRPLRVPERDRKGETRETTASSGHPSTLEAEWSVA